jgi:iron complex outermembrane recepter protein
MKPSIHRAFRVTGFSLFAAVAAPAADAQSAPAPVPTAQPPVELSPFVVDDTKDVGYLATNTLAGSRFNTALKDTPATVSVMTSEFLSDIGATQIEEAMQYAVNVEFSMDDDREAINGNSVAQGYQGYRTRGLDASRSRNFFTLGGRAVPDEMAFVDRIEDSRGPNSVMSGIAQPGGTINTGTKQALMGRAFQRGSVMFGAYDSKRATLDLNRPLGKKLGVRLNLVYNDNNSFRNFEHQEHLRGQIAATYKFSERTRVRMEFERGQLETNAPTGDTLRDSFIAWSAAGRPTTATQTAIANTTRINQNNRRVTFIGNDNTVIDMRGTLATSGTGHSIADEKIVDHAVNWGGPAQNRFSRFGIFSAFFEHQLGKNTFLEFGYNHSEQSFDNRDPRVNRQLLFGDPNQRLNGAGDVLNGGGANPHVGQLFMETNWFRTVRWDQTDTYRGQLSNEIDLKRWGNYQFAGVAEYEKRFFLSRTFRELWVDAATGVPPFNAAPDNALNNVFRRTYVTEGDWDTYALTGPVGTGGLLTNVRDPVSGRTLSSAWLPQGAPNESYIKQKSGMLVGQARYFKKRLIVMGGLRRDEYDEFRLATGRNTTTQIFGVIRDPKDPGTSSNSTVGRTKTFGAVYHVKPWLSLITNIATNVSVPASGQFMLDPSGDPTKEPIPVPKPVGRGRDYGIGISLLDNRLYFKATYYKTQATNQSTTSPAPVRADNIAIMDLLLGNRLISQADYDARVDVGGHGLFGHESKGFELELVGNVTENWRVTAGFSQSKPVENYRFSEWLKWEGINSQFLQQFRNNATVGAEITRLLADIHGELIAQTSAVGVGKLGNRENKFTTTTRYNIRSGWLKNAYVGGSYRHQSKMFVGTDLATGAKLYGNSYGYVDFLAGYALPAFKRDRRLSFQLNVYNVLNRQKPLLIRYTPQRRFIVQPPTTWRLTTNLEF